MKKPDLAKIGAWLSSNDETPSPAVLEQLACLSARPKEQADRKPRLGLSSLVILLLFFGSGAFFVWRLATTDQQKEPPLREIVSDDSRKDAENIQAEVEQVLKELRSKAAVAKNQQQNAPNSPPGSTVSPMKAGVSAIVGDTQKKKK